MSFELIPFVVTLLCVNEVHLVIFRLLLLYYFLRLFSIPRVREHRDYTETELGVGSSFASFPAFSTTHLPPASAT